MFSYVYSCIYPAAPALDAAQRRKREVLVAQAAELVAGGRRGQGQGEGGGGGKEEERGLVDGHHIQGQSIPRQGTQGKYVCVVSMTGVIWSWFARDFW
jgi:hypothetical protein